ncbi:EAF7 family protein [Ascoidea rubescens DSM 1968]|uniref:Chromatin modification-related protein EAF7 n=1 Tax=Ascoidea rubescens DSM 1968 TaxID=1344418 RepID=A0A1D2VCJ0_9ASCO|nr:CT20-domain-containing protein [Ascoidea rubescens DSM 1968]ODV59444.1 CT20-domain-containing protein [Ascoidea rubescens DSM 1968]
MRKWSLDEEISLFKAICQHKPVGKHKYSNMLCILNQLNSDVSNTSNQSEKNLIRVEDIWEKLRYSFNLDGLDELELSESDYFENDDDTDSSDGKNTKNANAEINQLFNNNIKLNNLEIVKGREFELPYKEFGALIEEKAISLSPEDSSDGDYDIEEQDEEEDDESSDDDDDDDDDDGEEEEEEEEKTPEPKNASKRTRSQTTTTTTTTTNNTLKKVKKQNTKANNKKIPLKNTESGSKRKTNRRQNLRRSTRK